MYYSSSFPLAVLISLSALNVQALLYPREAGLLQLPSTPTIERVDERYRDSRQERNPQSLHVRDRDALYQSDHGVYHLRAGANDERNIPAFGRRDLNIHSRNSYHNAQTKLHARSGRGINVKALVQSPFARPRPSEAPLPRVGAGGTPLARAGSDGNYPPNVNMGMAFGSSTELSSDTDGSNKPLLAGGARHGPSEPSDRDPHPAGGHIEVHKGQSGFLSYSGEESYMISAGFTGGIGVVAKGAPATGAVIAHIEISAGYPDTIRLMWILLMQKNIHKEAKVYVPSGDAELMHGPEMTAIKHALRASGIWDGPQIIPYAVSETHPGGFTLTVDTHGIDKWEAVTRAPRVLSPPRSRRPELTRTMSKFEELPQQPPPRMRLPMPLSEPGFVRTESGLRFERPSSSTPNLSSPDSPISPPAYGPSVHVPFRPAGNGPGASQASTPRFGSPIRGASVPSSQQGSPQENALLASGPSTPRFGSPIRASRVSSSQGSPEKDKKPPY